MSLVELHLGWLKGVAFLEYNVCLVPRMIAAHMFDKKTFGYVAQPKGKFRLQEWYCLYAYLWYDTSIMPSIMCKLNEQPSSYLNRVSASTSER